MAIQSLRNVSNDIINHHEIDPSNMTPEMKKGITDRRMKLYKLICYCGVAMVMWIDKAALLNSVYQYSHIAAQICTVIYWFFCTRDPTVCLVEAARHE
ncbi:unnamed protein product [Urochloa humidicola]